MKFLSGVLILPVMLLISSCSAHREYIGLPIEEARALATERGLPSRVIGSDDGKIHDLTHDFRRDRLNFVIRKGKVVRVRDDGEFWGRR